MSAIRPRPTSGYTPDVPALDYESPFPRLLRPGEQLLWVGRPRRQPTAFAPDPLVVLWALFAAAWAYKFAVWAAGALHMGDGGAPPSPRWSALLFGGGCYAAYRLVLIRRRRGALWYALTDARAVFALVRKVPSVISIHYDEVKEIRLTRRADGYGSITFDLHKQDPYAASSDVIGGHAAPQRPVFEEIAAAADAYDLASAAKHRYDSAPKAYGVAVPIR